jgi:uncharacterized membrane protein
MTDAAVPKSSDEGKTMGVIAYLLYLLSWPTIGLFMIIGVIMAYAARGSATAWVRTHLDKQVKLFWTTLGWMVLVGIAWVVGLILVPLFGFGLLVWGAVGILVLVIAIWFHLAALMGLIALAQDRPAA